MRKKLLEMEWNEIERDFVFAVDERPKESLFGDGLGKIIKSSFYYRYII
jgi:hypothetical protein